MARRILAIVWTDKAEEHIWKRHRVSTGEVEEAVRNEPLVRRGMEDLYYAYGRTDAGRYLFIVLAELKDGRGLVVTARDMTKREIQIFRRRGK